MTYSNNLQSEHLYSLKTSYNLRNMKSKQYFLLNVFIIIACILLIPLAASTDNIKTLDEVKQGSSVIIPQSGSNGTASWANCNITTIYGPNHEVLINNVAMVKNGFSFNYSLSGAYTNSLGGYIVEGFCTDGYNIVTFGFKFLVTTTGSNSSISLWISLILLAVAVILLIIAFVFDSEYIGFISGTIFIVAGLYVMIYGFGNMADLYTRAIGMVLMAVGLLIFFVSAFYAYDDENATGFRKLLGIEEIDEPYDETDHFQRKDGDD